MTTIERIYGAVRVALETFASNRYRPSADPFSFDADPRTDLESWYIRPSSTTSTGAVGGVESVVCTLVIWLSREAGHDAAGAALGLAADLARLRPTLAGLDVDPGGPVNVDARMTTDVQPRASDAVTVVGRLVVRFDYEETAESP